MKLAGPLAAKFGLWTGKVMTLFIDLLDFSSWHSGFNPINDKKLVYCLLTQQTVCLKSCLPSPLCSISN